MPRPKREPLPDGSRIRAALREDDFLDGYSIESKLAPRAALERGLSLPGWAEALLRLRNLLMRPFGLKTDMAREGEGAIFPLRFDSPDEIHIGTEDRHLDFRIVVMREGGRIHMGTWVRPHNLWGRLYLAAVMPAHVLILRGAVARMAG